MANLNKTECDCFGFYDPSGGCLPYDPEVHTTEPCPNNFWGTVGGWDWQNISDNAMQWGYALGIFTPPNAVSMENQAYMMELQRQKDQMMYIMVGLGITMLIVVLVVLRKK
jgi:hypothetical protein